MKFRILELYSGIGGMHCAWKEINLLGDVVAAVDINTVANSVYKHNFPKTNLITKNIQSLKPEELNKMEVNMILMSPPCQPFTRNGKFLDGQDPRTDSFLYLLNILDQLPSIEYILLENVKGFECSEVRNLFLNKLKECNFDYQELLICPSSIGIPNSRLRYYCMARRTNFKWSFKRKDEILHHLPNDYSSPFTLEKIIETDVDETKYLLDDKVLKWGKVLDICCTESARSCCFTKAYSHYVDGTGSVFTPYNSEMVEKYYKMANTYPVGSAEYIEALKPLKLRYFTPREIMSLMAFPETYSFPLTVTRRQCYRLLGNSVNVKVISEILKILCSN